VKQQNLCALLILCGAFLLRCLLAWNTWPLLNSDEGTMGIMAIHILHGARPIFFYGQNYMGTVEAYVGAMLFGLFGISVFTLRLGLILLFTLFLVCIFVLTSKLYSRGFAVFALLILSLGSNAVLSRQLMALGGYVESLFFTSLIFLLAYHLALSSSGNPVPRRLMIYGCLGLVIGLGLWSDLIIVPWVCCASILLVAFCWRELLKGASLAFLLGLVIGTFPLILYNIGAAPDQTSWATLVSQQGSVLLTLNTLFLQIKNTMEVSIPTITGSPFCHVDELSAYKILGFEASEAPSWQCHIIGVSWSLVYLLLLAVSGGLSVFFLKKKRSVFQLKTGMVKERPELVKKVLQSLLCAGSLWTLLLYIHTHAPLDGEAEYSRYLIVVWMATPVVLWPLWKGATQVRSVLNSRRLPVILRGKTLVCRCALAIVLTIFLYGTVKTVAEIPLARAANVQESQLIDGLLEHHITHVYASYWMCDRLAFQSREQIICGVLAGECTLRRGFHNRYAPYYTIVSTDPDSSYLLRTGITCDRAVHLKMSQEGKSYRTFIINEYTIYQPT